MRSLLFGILSLAVPALCQNISTFSLGHTFHVNIQRPRIPAGNFSTVSYVDPRTGERRSITYTLGDGRNVIYEDDINWGPESQLLAWSNNNQRPPSRRGIGVKSKYAWPDATITYRYDSCETRETLSSIFDSAIKEWKKGAPFLQFKQLAPSPYDGTAAGILTITKHDGNSWWCNSNIALDNGGVGMRMNLQWLDKNGGMSCGQSLEPVVHELGHAIGLHHEQTRPDRAANIIFDCTKYAPWTVQGCENRLYPECCDPAVRGVEKCCNDWGNYEIADPNIYDMYGPYDCKSVMHYPAGGPLASSATCNIAPGLLPSEGDFNAVCEIYTTFCKPWKDLNFCASSPKACGTCNPISGLNKCDITTSCISTGTKFHCACRAGYKAVGGDNDITKHFRLPWDNYRHLVFVPENTPCNTLCNNPNGFSPELCAEVSLQNTCPL